MMATRLNFGVIYIAGSLAYESLRSVASHASLRLKHDQALPGRGVAGSDRGRSYYERPV